jgi:hypothetical protein
LYRFTSIINVEKQIRSRSKDSIIIERDKKLIETERYANKVILINKGSNITFSKNANLFFKDCDIIITGEQNAKINFIGTNNNSIFFNNCNVNIIWANFSHLSNLETESVKLPSAVTFYNSNVHIENSVFQNNQKGDDLLNIYNSKFFIKNTTVRNAYADAIDSDFSRGDIYNVRLIDIGNDGLDFSGSNVNINDSFFKNIADKAISAGEASVVLINKSTIKDSEMAIVVKDGSQLISRSNFLINNKIDYAVFFKKDFYPSPELSVDSLNINSVNLFQKNTKVNMIFDSSVEYLDDVESLLYGNYYGKSSK